MASRFTVWCCGVVARHTRYCNSLSVIWFQGSSGIPLTVTLCISPSATSADLSGTVRAATVCVILVQSTLHPRVQNYQCAAAATCRHCVSTSEEVYKLVSELHAEVPKEQTRECKESLTNVTSVLSTNERRDRLREESERQLRWNQAR